MVFSLGIVFRAKITNKSNVLDNAELEGALAKTWNDLFNYLSPIMIEAASEARMKQKINDFIFENVAADIAKKYPSCRIYSINIYDNDFLTGKI